MLNSISNEPLYSTSAAAKYCSNLGRPASFSLLTKIRTKGQADPGDHGPEWLRDPITGRIWYRQTDLDTWVNAWKQRLAKTPAKRPAQFDRTAA